MQKLKRQLTTAKALLRQMRETVEDIGDAPTIERTKRANGDTPRVPWSQIKNELQLNSATVWL
jgi:hypothetical protein